MTISESHKLKGYDVLSEQELGGFDYSSHEINPIIQIPPCPGVDMDAALNNRSWRDAFPPITVAPETNTYPFAAISKISSQSDNGAVHGSALLIAPRLIVTAAHCVYSQNTRRWHTDFRLDWPDGNQVSRLVGMYVPRGYMSNDDNFDYAIGILDVPCRSDYCSIDGRVPPDGDSVVFTGRIREYPNGEFAICRGKVDHHYEDMFRSTNHSRDGLSGGPTLVIDLAQRNIYAAGTVKGNSWSVSFTPARIHNINELFTLTSTEYA